MSNSADPEKKLADATLITEGDKNSDPTICSKAA